MPAGVQPIFTAAINVSCVEITAANTSSRGSGTIGTDLFKAFTAGSNGAFVEAIRIVPAASVAATSTTATVLRVFLSSATTGATTAGTNTFLLGEMTAPAQSADHATTGTYPWELVLNRPIPAGWTILVASHAAPASNTWWHTTVFGGDY